jgi:RNA polymerase sigma-70 factor, ECF subfamily
MTGSPAAADDITQEVFLVVIRDCSRYRRGRATVKAWLYGIARNLAKQRMDRERSYVPFADDTGTPSALAQDEKSPDAEFARTERIEAVQRAVLELPFRYREAIVPCDLQEMSYADAAAALHCAVGTVRSRLHRGRALLAARLSTSEKLTWMNECKLTI